MYLITATGYNLTTVIEKLLEVIDYLFELPHLFINMFSMVTLRGQGQYSYNT